MFTIRFLCDIIKQHIQRGDKMTNEYQTSSVESECAEAEVEIYRHEVLRKLFACLFPLISQRHYI